MIIKLYNEQPNARLVQQVVSVLEKGGIIIYPTDTVYGIGCDITNPKAIEKIYKIRGLDPKKAHLSFICYDLTDISQYTKPFNTKIFRIVKRALPGPYTFIFNETTKVPKLLSSKKKTVGIRVPDNNIIREIVKQLGRPIVTTSIRDDDEIIEYSTDPELIHEKYENTVDLVIDGGDGDNTPSTVVDVSSGDVEVIREGKGEVDWMF